MIAVRKDQMSRQSAHSSLWYLMDLRHAGLVGEMVWKIREGVGAVWSRSVSDTGVRSLTPIPDLSEEASGPSKGGVGMHYLQKPRVEQPSTTITDDVGVNGS